MNIHDATEQAYKNGYEQGLKDAVKHGWWVSCVFEREIKCSICGCELKDEWKYRHCPNCGARMDLEGAT